MYLLSGLGNPHKKYIQNRHNVGFIFLDYLVEKYDFTNFKNNGNYCYTKFQLNEENVILVKPLTYMNYSGFAIVNALSFFKINIENLILIYDEADLSFGNIRIREKGSASGHNGVKNIIQHLGTDQFKRIRIGIGKVKNLPLKDYVLSDFSKEELETLKNQVFVKIEDTLKLIIKGRIKEAMSLYNAKNSL